MDFFSNIDWQQLNNLVKDLELLTNETTEYNGKAKLELTKLLYLIESDFAEFKTKLNLPLLNSTIKSKAVVQSFRRVEEYSQIFEKYDIKFNSYLRSNDYQYWLLIYLLIKNNKIRAEKLTLYKIIDEFVSRIKEDSLYLEDIELTGSGATRCITNIRFAFSDLKHMGLVYLYDPDNKNSWTLTFVGFFVAASLCLDPVDRDKHPLSKKVTRFNQSTYYYSINKYLLERCDTLADPGYFYKLVRELKIDSLDLKELEKGPDIFRSYFQSVNTIFEKERNERGRSKALAVYLNRLNEEYPLVKYVEQLSLKFDAEAFFHELIQSVNKH